MGKTKIILEVDSLSAVQLCLYSPSGTHSYSPLISAIRNLCGDIGEAHIIYQFREVNACADTLAKAGHGLQPGLHLFSSLPSSISLAFHADFSGPLHSRLVAT